MDRPSTKAAQRAHTHAALMRSARKLFARDGYRAVGVADVAAAAGVTKGAFYHLFESKSALFAELALELHREVAAQVDAATEGLEPWDQLVVGCETFLRASTAPDVAQILLIDGPAVLGWSAWQELDQASSAHELELGLAQLVEAGEIEQQPLEPLKHLLSGGMNEAAIWIAKAPDRAQALAETISVQRRLLDSLRAS